VARQWKGARGASAHRVFFDPFAGSGSLPLSARGQFNLTAIAWLWARTVKSKTTARSAPDGKSSLNGERAPRLEAVNVRGSSGFAARFERAYESTCHLRQLLCFSHTAGRAVEDCREHSKGAHHGRVDIPTPEHSTPTRVVGRSSSGGTSTADHAWSRGSNNTDPRGPNVTLRVRCCASFSTGRVPRPGHRSQKGICVEGQAVSADRRNQWDSKALRGCKRPPWKNLV
jgi:hypothetical protein